MPAKPSPNRVPADPTKWSTESQGSPAASWTTEYTDIHYKCRHCRATATFFAADQRHTYEVKKASIDQQRVLCEPCWRESLRIAAELAEHQRQWEQSKQSLRTDKPFLARWLQLLESQEEYGHARHDVARKNMLRKLLGAA
jgi:hypothetical protein